MTSTVSTSAPSSARSGATCRPDTVCTDLALEASTSGGKGVGRNLLIDMNSLSMLAQVIEPREPSVAMTLKRTFARVFANMASQVLAPGEAEVAGRISCAEKPLTFLLSRGRVCLARVGIIVRPKFIIIVVHIHVQIYGR